MPAAAETGPFDPLALLPAPLPELARAGLASIPERAAALRGPLARHRALGRLVRDVVLDRWVGGPTGGADSAAEPGASAGTRRPRSDDLAGLALEALGRLRDLQSPGGTFRSGDNVDSPPDSAFTLNDLAWARRAIEVEGLQAGPDGLGGLLPVLDELLAAAAPALVTGGVHTPNHRWEISAALVRLWELTGRVDCRARAEQWLAEGVDLQADGLFSERSANYAAHVSVPSLLVLARVLGREDLRAAADRATRAQAELTGPDGMIETIASRRQDQGAPFDGGAMLPVLHAHAARTGDPRTARAARRVLPRADTEAALTLLALGLEDRTALGALPAAAADPSAEAPEVHEFADSGLHVVDHGRTRVVIHGGTDTAALGRVTSGAASNPTLLRFSASGFSVRELRLSRDFFSLGPLRPSSPRRLPEDRPGEEPIRFGFEERVAGEYFHPLAAADRSPDGAYALTFNGRFAAAMDFSRRTADEVALATRGTVEVHPGRTVLRLAFTGPTTALCLLLALEGGELAGDHLELDAQGRHVLRAVEPGEPAPAAGGGTAGEREAAAEVVAAAAELVAADGSGRLRLTARGALGGPAFYAPGEAFTFLGGTDEPTGTILLIPASSTAELELEIAAG